jgi:hypothetical protein
MKTYRGVNVNLNIFLTSVPKGNGQLHVPASLPPGKTPVAIAKEAEWAPEPIWTRWRRESFLIGDLIAVSIEYLSSMKID